MVIFILGSVFPSVEKYMLERPREIAVTSTNVYELNFSEEWKKLQTKLNIVEDARLTRINIIFNADGKLKTVNGEFIGKEKNEFIIYDLDIDSNTNKYIIQKNKSTQDVANYRDLVTLTRFFHVVDQVGLKNMFPSTLNEDQYAIFAMGETNMGKQTEEMVCFIENDGTVKKVDYDTLPLGLPFMHVDNYFYYYYP